MTREEWLWMQASVALVAAAARAMRLTGAEVYPAPAPKAAPR